MKVDRNEKHNLEEVARLEKVYQEEVESLLNKYGPEGSYWIAEKLIECINKDISNE